MKTPKRKFQIDDEVKVKDCDRTFKIHSIGLIRGINDWVCYPVGENGFVQSELIKVKPKAKK